MELVFEIQAQGISTGRAGSRLLTETCSLTSRDGSSIPSPMATQRQSLKSYLPDKIRTARKTALVNRPVNRCRLAHARTKGGALVLFAQLKQYLTRRVNQPLMSKKRRRTFKGFHLHNYEDESLGLEEWAESTHGMSGVVFRRAWILFGGVVFDSRREVTSADVDVFASVLNTTDIHRNVQSLHLTH